MSNAMRAFLLRYGRIAPALTFLLSLLLLLLCVYALERSQRQRAFAQYNGAVATLASSIEDRSLASQAYLRAAAAMFEAVDKIPRSVFASFANDVRLDQNFSGSVGMGWSVALRKADVPAFEAAQSAARGSDFKIWPAESRNDDVIHPVTYLVPENEKNSGVAGYNMYSESTRRQAMDAARLTRKPAATARVLLVLDRGKATEPGFIIYMPVFASEQPASADRPLRGYVYSPFRVSDFVRSAISPNLRDSVWFEVYDERVAPDRLMFRNSVESADLEYVERTLHVADRVWMLRVGHPVNPALSTLSAVALLLGLVFSVLALVILSLMVKAAEQDRNALEREQQQRTIRETLTRELNHRVKNTLANVLSIASLARRRATDLDSYADALVGRITALSATHDLLTDADWGMTRLDAIIAAELRPYGGDIGDAVTMAGPDLVLPPSDALAVGLGLHELATNAAKFGALSVPDGRLLITWSIVNETHVELVWQECDGPPVVAPSRRGFGSDLIERILAHELGNPVVLEFAPDGLRCRFSIPIRTRSQFVLSRKADCPPTGPIKRGRGRLWARRWITKSY